ncbi:MAG: hypothetical protein QXV06_04370 [Ignisphaera sp.]
MKIKQLLEILSPFLDINKYDLFAGIEEMKVLGFNIINFVLDLGQDVEHALLSLKYTISTDELEPIAVVIQPKYEKIRELNLDKVLRLIYSYGGYIYGGQERIGFLIPIQEENLSQVFLEIMPKIIEVLLGYSIKPRIIGYTLNFYQEI